MLLLQIIAEQTFISRNAHTGVKMAPYNLRHEDDEGTWFRH